MYAMYNSLVDDSQLRALGVLGDDVIVAGTAVEAQFPCPPGACSFDWVTLFPVATPTTINGSKRLLNNQFVNYAGDGQGGSQSWESIYVPEGWRATILWMAAISGGATIANDGYVSIEVVDGPAFKQFAVKIDPSRVEWIGPGRNNSLSIDFKSGQLLNFVPAGAAGGLQSGSPQGVYPRLSHIQAFDLRSAEMKARQAAEAERRLQVKSLQTEAKLSELDAEAAARVAEAAQKAAEALAAAKANQAAREEARGSYTSTQAAAAGAQISELITETTAARLAAEQKQNQLANEQKIAADQQYVALRNQVLSKDYRSWLPYALGGIGLLGVLALGYARIRRG